LDIDVYEYISLDTTLLLIFISGLAGYEYFFAYQWWIHHGEYFGSGIGMMCIIFAFVALTRYLEPELFNSFSLSGLREAKRVIRWKLRQGLTEYHMYKHSDDDAATSPTTEVNDTSDSV